MCPLTPSRKVFRTRRRRRKGPQGPAGPAPLCKRRGAAGDPLPGAVGRPQGRVPGAARSPEVPGSRPTRARPARPVEGRGGAEAGALADPEPPPLGPMLGGRTHRGEKEIGSAREDAEPGRPGRAATLPAAPALTTNRKLCPWQRWDQSQCARHVGGAWAAAPTPGIGGSGSVSLGTWMLAAASPQAQVSGRPGRERR